MSTQTALLAPETAGLERAAGRAIIRHHSKSFSLASLLLAPGVRDQAVGLYAYCRRADDAIDLVEPAQAPAALARLRRELDEVYAGRALTEPVLVEFQRLVFERRIPREYPEALLEGFELDARGESYQSFRQLYRYCWCVAGSVGAMMCHVLGVRSERAVVHGAHLGMAMQLTNICRDVAEDFARGRLYLPSELVPELESFRESRQLPAEHALQLAGAVRRLLKEARVLYESGDLGLPLLSFRSRLAVGAARRIYSAIGDRILAQRADVWAGRAVVPGSRKALSVLAAFGSSVRLSLSAPARPSFLPQRILRFPEDVLPS